jgi:hypothetical protein
MLVGKAEGNTPLGKPRRRWKSNRVKWGVGQWGILGSSNFNATLLLKRASVSFFLVLENMPHATRVSSAVNIDWIKSR